VARILKQGSFTSTDKLI